MLVTLFGIVTLVKLPQAWNASAPMWVTLLPNVRLVSLSQAIKALSPMSVTVLGIVTLVRLLQPANASNPMLVTGRPLMVSGMVTTLVGPVYPVMVIVPLVVM